MAMRCRCPYAGHQVGCPVKSVHEERGRLYDGLYDGRSSGRPSRTSARIQLLNPSYDDGDATARRFAQLEVD
jgi:hypothetical protein